MKWMAVSMVVAAVLMRGGEARDLAAPVNPGMLPWLYEIAFDQAKFRDLRGRAGELRGVRLLCLNDRFSCYEFSVFEEGEGAARFTTTVFRRGEGVESEPGRARESSTRVLAEEEWLKLSKLIDFEELKALPPATLPVSVGHPDFFLMELFDGEEHTALYRDAPALRPVERRLERFNALAAALIVASGVEGYRMILPEGEGDEVDEEEEEEGVRRADGGDADAE